MNYKLDITESFENDISAVVDYISHKLYNPAAAERLLKNTEKIISEISGNPFIYPVYHDKTIAEMGYHYTVISKYLVFYLIDETNKIVHLSRFLYGSQNITDILS